MIFKKLQPGFVGKVTCVDERSFEDFVRDANRAIDQVWEPLEDPYASQDTDVRG